MQCYASLQIWLIWGLVRSPDGVCQAPYGMQYPLALQA